MTKTETRRINSEEDALAFWIEEYGEPNSFISFDELADVEIKLAYLKLEDESLKREIASRDVFHMNEYKINKSIELHFLLEAGSRYFDACAEYAGMQEERLEKEYDRDFREYNDYKDNWRDDSLFPRNYED